MASIGISKAKTHLPELLNRVARGERITITRYGVPAAVLIPVEETQCELTHKEIVKRMRTLRKRVKPDQMSVREMIQEERRFVSGATSS